jgi:prepilin-type N-terminal cleavage/methylation domain-containing protein
MKNEGFTLMELLAVIIIMGILIIMIVPSIMSIRNNVLENALENRVSMIENAAKDYAHDNIIELKSSVTSNYSGEKTANDNCIYRNVNFLINNGYISSSNTYVVTDESDGQIKENQILDPTTGKSMNNRRVCIRFDTNDAVSRSVIAYLVEE